MCSPQNSDSICSQKEVSQNAHRSFIRNSKNLETSMVPVNQGIHKQINIFEQGILFSNKKIESSINTATQTIISSESSQTQKVHAI